MTQEAPKSRFRLLRFNLKTLMIFMLLAGVFLGVVIPGQQRAKRETETIKTLKGLMIGGWEGDFEYSYDYQFHELQRISALDSRPKITDEEATNRTPKPIRAIFGEHTFSHVQGIRIDRTTHNQGFAVDQAVDLLPAFRKLKLLHIRVFGGALGDLITIGKLKSLRNFRLESGLSLQRLEGIENLHRLEFLALRNTGIKSAKELTSLDRLRHLELSWCYKLENLDFLGGLPQLESLNIGHFPYIRKFDFAALPNNQLRELKLQGFNELANTDLLGTFSNLERLELVACKGLNSIAQIEKATAVKKLTLNACHSIESLAELKSLHQLEEVEINWCSQLRDFGSLSQLKGLKKLTLSSMKMDRLPELDRLPTVEEIVLDGLSQLESVEQLAGLDAANLTSLVIEDCERLADISAATSLTNLKQITIRRCALLKPENVQQLSDSSSDLRITMR